MTVVILAGGKSSRMGRDKLSLPIQGETLLLRAVRRYAEVFDRVLVSVSGPDRYPELGSIRVFDRETEMGPMAGLQAGLLQAGEPVFLTAADMPFSDPQQAAGLFTIPGEWDACVPEDREGRPEPLFGWYRPAVLPALEEKLAAGRRSMNGLLDVVRTRRVPISSLGENAERILLNVNNPADYDKLCLELRT